MTMAAAVPHGQHAQPADVLSCPPQQSPGSLQGLEDVFSEMARRSRSAAEASAAAKNEETQQSENTTATPRNTTETSHSASSALKADAEGNSTEVKPKSAMEEQIQRLADKLWAKYLELPQSKRLLIAVSGIPGSGKTTLAAKVAAALDKRYKTENQATGAHTNIAVMIPMDGYHLTREQLSAMPDPTTVHARRGAAFTFDAAGYLALIQRLREPICPETGTLTAPAFDHATKDPVADAIAIPRTARIVLLEGNYLSLGSGAKEWREAAELMDELWFVEVEEAVARKRLIARHVASGIVEDEEAAGRRADENDLVNGREIIAGRLPVQEVIVSREDEGWKPEKAGAEDK